MIILKYSIDNPGNLEVVHIGIFIGSSYFL